MPPTMHSSGGLAATELPERVNAPHTFFLVQIYAGDAGGLDKVASASTS
jgi:hypothetical protein